MFTMMKKLKGSLKAVSMWKEIWARSPRESVAARNLWRRLWRRIMEKIDEEAPH